MIGHDPIDVRHTCGHMVKVDAKDVKDDSHLTRLRSRTCNPCFKRAIANARAEACRNGWPALVGTATSRQIDWALMVRSAKLSELDALNRPEQVLARYRSILLRVTDAKRWLDGTRNGHLSADAVLASWATADDKAHIAAALRGTRSTSDLPL